MTARFTFRLEPVLGIRQRREELLQQELARAIAALAAQEEAAIAAEAEVALRITTLRALQAGGVVEITRLRVAHDAVVHARRVADHERAGALRMERVAADRQADLVRASQEREALVQLKRRDHEAHDREERRREGAALDEIGIRRHAAARRAASR